MNTYIKVKKSQLSLYKIVPFYCLSKDGEAVLYKQSGSFLNKIQLREIKDIDIFIKAEDRSAAAKELMASLNMELGKKIAQKGVKAVRTVLCNIVEEALSEPLEQSSQTLPETIEIMFYGYFKNPELLESLTQISTSSNIIIEHSVNVFALTMLYCCIHDLPIDMTKTLGVSALLHDIGTTRIEKAIIENDHKLTEKEFEIYESHPEKGHDIISNSAHFRETIANVALEHHEKLDGSGYPNGITDISFESQLIGLIDSYESLTYRAKAFRKEPKPYDTMKILKEEVMAQKYNKEIFRNFCFCLTK